MNAEWQNQSLLRLASPRLSWCRGNAVTSDEERLAGEESVKSVGTPAKPPFAGERILLATSENRGLPRAAVPCFCDYACSLSHC